MDTQNIDAFAALPARITQLENALNNPAPAPPQVLNPRYNYPRNLMGIARISENLSISLNLSL
jgi:hypothetical protein